MSHDVVEGILEQTRTGALRSPISNTLQMDLVEFDREAQTVVYEMPARAELGNPLGVIQGGVVSALADAAMAAASMTVLDDEQVQQEAVTTIDLFSRFIRPINANSVERLRAEAKVVRAGSRLVWVEADLLADGKPVGKFAATGMRVAFDPSAYIAGGSSDE